MPVGASLEPRDHIVLADRLEQVRIPALSSKIVLDRSLAPDLRDRRHLTVRPFEHREEACLARETRDRDRLAGGRSPAQWAGDEHMDVARAVQGHRVLHLRLEIPQVGDRRSGDIWDLVGERDQRHELSLPPGGAGMIADRLSRRGPRRRRCRRRSLDSGVHVALVVVTDVEHVVAPLEHARQAPEPDVDGAAVTALADHTCLGVALGTQRGGDPAGDRAGVAEQRVQPGQPPRGLWIGRGEHLQAAGRIGGDQLSVGGAHRGIERIACAERFAASLTRG